MPVSGEILEGIDDLNNMFNKVCYGKLPGKGEWLEHLEILHAIRIAPSARVLKFGNYYHNRLPGYVAIGIKRDSEDYAKAIKMLHSVSLSEKILINHELNEGYLRIPVVSKMGIDDIRFSENDDSKPEELSYEQKQILYQIYAMYETNKYVSHNIHKRFREEIRKRHYLNMVMEWWNDIPTPFSITAVGRLLAHANAKKFDESLPDIEM